VLRRQVGRSPLEVADQDIDGRPEQPDVDGGPRFEVGISSAGAVGAVPRLPPAAPGYPRPAARVRGVYGVTTVTAL